MDYLNKLDTLKKNLRNSVITEESFLYDLEFLLSEISSALEKLFMREDEILYPSVYGTENLDVVKSAEYNTSILLTINANPAIRQLLQTAIYQNRYGLVINSCEAIFTSDLPSAYKRSVQDIYRAALIITGYEEIKETKKTLIKSKIIINNYIQLCKKNHPHWLNQAEKNEAYLSRSLSKTNPIKDISIIESFGSILSE